MYVLCLHAFAKWPYFPHLLQFASSAGLLCIGDQFGALQNLHDRFWNCLVFGFVPNLFILCIGSSFINCFPFDEINASGIVFFLFFFSYVFCLISVIIFFKSSVFSLIILSRNFLSFIAVIYLEICSSSAEIVPKLHSFSISISRLQNSSGVSSSDCFAQQKSPQLW